ncbi:homeobox protein ESX1-like [Ischnura elegans]|uniref:homeobox protein ESX1-like n=1 Tax=Ischnura elegans TaxID=197161 RepID=UPI001ED8BE24|nr:homeobox protein ESX1-like [Ischnura elegans]
MPRRPRLARNAARARQRQEEAARRPPDQPGVSCSTPPPAPVTRRPTQSPSVEDYQQWAAEAAAHPWPILSPLPPTPPPPYARYQLEPLLSPLPPTPPSYGLRPLDSPLTPYATVTRLPRRISDPTVVRMLVGPSPQKQPTRRPTQKTD